MSQLRGLSSYPIQRNLEPYYAYPVMRNLDPYGSYPITRNLDPLGDASGAAGSLVSSALDSVSGGLFNSIFGAATKTQPTSLVINAPPPQPAPPTPFNWTPVIVSTGVVLVALTLIMTTRK